MVLRNPDAVSSAVIIDSAAVSGVRRDFFRDKSRCPSNVRSFAKNRVLYLIRFSFFPGDTATQIKYGINLYGTLRAHSSHSFPNSFRKTSSSTSALRTNSYEPRAAANPSTVINFLVESTPR